MIKRITGSILCATGIFLLSATNSISAPTAPNLTSPVMESASTPVSFEWDALFDADWYRLWVKDEEGVAYKQWHNSNNVCNIIGDGLCSVVVDQEFAGVSVWQVRGYDSDEGELGAWSDRAKFWNNLERPEATTLQSPLAVAFDSELEFIWNQVPAASWYKLEILDEASESPIVSQWLRDDGNRVECDEEEGLCFKTTDAVISGSFLWRVRTYNSAGLGPWTDFEFVEFVGEDILLSAVPNPLIVPACEFAYDVEIFVTNDSNQTVEGLDVIYLGNFVLQDNDELQDEIECRSLESLRPESSCVVSGVYLGNSFEEEDGATQLIIVDSDNAQPLEIIVEQEACELQ